jgi:putative membrane protein
MADTAGFQDWLAVYLKGACMGAADTVPGVSGGTIAVIVGIYERLITALTSVDPRAVRHLGRLHTSEGRADLVAELVRMEVPFLLVLGAGVLSAAASIATAVNVAVETYPAPTYAFFFGLIAASAVVLYRYVDPATPRRGLVALVGFGFAFAVTDPSLTGAVEPTPLTVFVAGAVAVSAMVLPGISGAFLLLVMGHYEYVSGIPRAVFGGLLEAVGGSTAALLDALVPFAAFLSGAVVGVFSVAYAVRAALDRYREATLVFLVSLMVGALRLPVYEVTSGVSAVTPRSLAVVCVPAVVGVVVVFALEYATDELEY